MSSEKIEEYSELYLQLDPLGKTRYKEKLKMLQLCTDPYLVDRNAWSTEKSLFPQIEFPDIFVYLISSPSPYTKEALKAYKSTEAWSYFVAGFVTEVEVLKTAEDSFIMTAKVKHSQRMNSPPLLPWVGLKSNGTILCAHCNCMAGAGEACSHIAAMLYAIATAVRIERETACTSVLCKWLEPINSGEVKFSTVEEMDIIKPKTLQCKQLVKKPNPTIKKDQQGSMSLDTFYSKLAEINSQASILSIVSDHMNKFIPQSCSKEFPTSISSMYDSKYLDMPYHELLEECKKAFDSLTVTSEQSSLVEQHTRDQSKSRLWYSHRAGRITASKFKAAVSTDAAMPSQSLIKSICYPEQHKFSSTSTNWGCEHEDDARQHYCAVVSPQHTNFTVRASGLVISSSLPHLAATPDGIITCDCCGVGTLEIKCPFCARDEPPDEAELKYLNDTAGVAKLKETHEYFFQVQAQLNICKVEFGDFVVWTPKGINVERILCDEAFFNEAVDKMLSFYVYGVLPEILGKWYTKQPVLSTIQSISDTGASEPENVAQDDDLISEQRDSVDTPLWCYCRKPENEEMIACDYPGCSIEWFHITCLKLHVIPKGRWYCPDCRKKFKGRHPPKH